MKITLGISACLLGHEVRFDGGHKRHAFINEQLSRYFDFIPHCPEMAIGLGTPRQAIRLVAQGNEIRAVGSRNQSLDVTEQLRANALKNLEHFSGVSGFILKKDSPSCGMERVKLYNDKQMPSREGQGIFAQLLMTHNPALPVEEEGRLMDSHLRENFIERVFIYARWQQMINEGLTARSLVTFHTCHKYAILSRGHGAYQELGQLIAKLGTSNEPLESSANRYLLFLMGIMKRQAKPGHHANVLMHMMGYLKNQLRREDKAELLEQIDHYRNGVVPLVVPMTLFKHLLKRHPHDYLQQQFYLNPYPEQLSLRNGV